MKIDTRFARKAAMTLVVAALAISPASASPSDIRWESRTDPAAAVSRETGKPILVEFWATWCEACKGMDAEVYSDPAVARAMTKVLPVRIDIDREPGIARRYGVSATPTLVLMDALGNELFRFTGRIERGPLTELLREFPADVTPINRLAAALGNDKSSFTTLEALGRELRQAALYIASTRYLERAMQTDAARGDAAVHGRLLATIGENYAALKRPDEAAASFEKALRDLRGRQEEPSVLLDLARAQIARGQVKEARATIDDLQRRFAGTPAAVDAAKLSLTVK
jgi:thioredoxin-like negative regulator of GroEL